MSVLIRDSVDGAGLWVSKYVYLLPIYYFCMKCRTCRKHKFIYLRNEHIIAEKLNPMEKNKLPL